jgi:putative membrane protein
MLYTLFINSLTVFFGAYLLKGIEIKNYLTAIGVAIVLAIVNVLIKPVIVVLTIPLTIITLGLFILVINAWMLMLTGKIVEGFKVHSFISALILGLILSVVNAILL